MGNSDKLVEVPLEDLPKLKDLFKKDWPKHIIAHHTIDNYLNWLTKTPSIPNLKIYSLNGEWKTNELYLIVDRFDLFPYSIAPNNVDFRKALKLLDWSNGLKISSFEQHNLADIRQVINELSLKQHYHVPFDIFYFPKEKGLELEFTIPEEIIMKPLSPEDAKTVNDVWPYRHHCSEFFVRRLIERNLNVGAYCKNTGELMGWMLTFASGCHGLLQVKENFLKRGIASLIAKYMTKERSKLGLDSYCFIKEDNIPSKIIFTKLGYNPISVGHWIHTIGSKPFEWED